MFDLLAGVILVLLLVAAGALVLRLRALADETDALRAELAAIRQAQRAAAQSGPVPVAPDQEGGNGASAEPAFAHRARAQPRQAGAAASAPSLQAPLQMPPLRGAGGNAFGSTGGSTQGQLPLAPDPDGGLPPVPLDVLIAALEFPETPDDTEGFRALRRALRDHRAGQLIRAAQDVLTLLSQEGLYMDDLVPDRARPELWRRFAHGERGEGIGALGGIRDRSALAMATGRLREDPVFRDATHHFLRRFDRMLAEREPDASDVQIAGLADTRTARAFMLLGRVMGIFD